MGRRGSRHYRLNQQALANNALARLRDVGSRKSGLRDVGGGGAGCGDVARGMSPFDQTIEYRRGIARVGWPYLLGETHCIVHCGMQENCLHFTLGKPANSKIYSF